MLEYTVVIVNRKRDETEALNTLIDTVESMIREDWEPLGGIASHFDGEYVSYHQAMIRKPQQTC